MSDSALGTAVGVAVACSEGTGDVATLRAVIGDALEGGVVTALVAQATLAQVVARLAETRVTVLLSDPAWLRGAAVLAEMGSPLTADHVGVSASALFSEAGLAAARFDG